MNYFIYKSSKDSITTFEIVNGKRYEGEFWGAGNAQFLDLDGSYIVFTI